MVDQPWLIELSDTMSRIITDVDGTVAVYPCRSALNDSDPATYADRLWEELEAHGYQGEPVLLALDSAICLTARMPIDSPKQLRNRQALLYQLEEWVPWAAEDFVADFASSNDRVLAVATRLEPLRDLIRRLEALGVRIQSIVPTALLLAAEHGRQASMTDRHLVAWQRDQEIDLMLFDGRDLVEWTWLAAEPSAVTQELLRFTVGSGQALPLVANLCDAALTESIKNCSGIELLEGDAATFQQETDAVLNSARSILAGTENPLVELRRDALGNENRHFAMRKQLFALQSAVLILLGAIVFALLVRSHHYKALADQYSDDQAHVYEQIFPNRPVPVGIRSRLESEFSKLNGVRGNTQELPAAVPAIIALRRVLQAMPDDRRFQLIEIRIEDGEIYLDGEVREHGDSEAIATLLRKHGFDVSPPRSQRLEGRRVSFRIAGMLKATDDGTAGAPTT